MFILPEDYLTYFRGATAERETDFMANADMQKFESEIERTRTQMQDM